MNTLGIFTVYTPEENIKGVVYLKDENGNCWYEVQKTLTKKYKIVMDSSFKILSYSEDASTLWPLNAYVVEFDELPDDFSIKSDYYITEDSSIVLKVDYEIKARTLRNSIRKSIDGFLLPASTISDVLVTEEQKNTLIQDSLSLAQWPTKEGWPYTQLPILSELCVSLITIPDWSYPEQTTV